MHIPDGFLSPPVCAATGGVAALAVAGALRQVRPEAEPGLGPRMGMTAAYVFAAQMVNFPVAAGTSGHLLGSVLVAVLLGPHAASLVMTAVFLVQALFFLDGGHTALGANVLNMGLAGTYGGYAVYRALAGPVPGRRRTLAAAGAAAWVAVLLGAGLTSAELVLSGMAPARTVFPVMLGIHAVIGVGEALLTAAALGLLLRARPDVVTGQQAATAGGHWGWAAAAGLVAVAALAPLASSAPDGLEWAAVRVGIPEPEAAPLLPGLMPDYTLPGLGEASWAPAAVSVLGAGLMLATLGLCLEGRRRSAAPDAMTRMSLGPPAHSSPGQAGDARVRLAAALGLAVTAALLPAAEAGKVVVLAVVALCWVLAVRAPGRWLAGRAVLLLPLLGLGLLALPGLRAGSHVGPATLGLAFLRAAVSFLATAAFLHGTPEPEVLAALRWFRLPPALAETVAFALRYLHTLGEEAGRMLQARAARSAGNGALVLRAGATGGIIGALFLRSFERSERVALAMAARGAGTASFGVRGPSHPAPGSETRSLSALPTSRLHPTDRVFLGSVLLLLLGVWLWR